ncbi:hypothetical protein Tco_0730107 [Tanacetum coccineum]|uniref:Uncharacterized protein n=1 Tax=Tanacetum coccineum TaxID=301880 RepID=A0ABQ4YRY0_9ASTR
MSKVLQERGSGSLPSSTEMNLKDHVNSISTTVETDTILICCIGSTRYDVSAQQNSKLIFKPRQATIPFPSHFYDDCYDEENGSYGLKDLDAHSIGTTLHFTDLGASTSSFYDKHEDVSFPLSLKMFLSTTHAKVDVFKRKITLRNKSSDDLEPTVEEGKVVNELMMDIVKTRCDFIGGLDDYPSNCDFDRRIHIDYAYNLKFSCMMGFEYVHANFLLILPINVMSKKFYNSIIKDKIEFNGRNELGNFVNAPIFIGNFYVISNFTVMEDMDSYLDEGMGDVIVGEPFCKASCVEARRFDGIITIRDGDDSVTYQMVRSNPRFKHLTNEKCNKIPSLLKVSEQDKMNRIPPSYQKLKGFYKGVLNLGPKFIRDAKVKEWLTRGHISVHDIE